MFTKITYSIVGLLTIVFVGFGFVGSAMATSTTQTVKGTVTQAGTPVANATVNVSCSGYSNVHQPVTSSAGKYTTTFSSNVCPVGQTITVSARNGAASDTVKITLQSGTNTVNLSLVAVAVPEFGPIAATVAAILSVALIWRIRTRQQSAY